MLVRLERLNERAETTRGRDIDIDTQSSRCMRPGGIFCFLFRSFFGSKVVQDLKMRSFSFNFILSAAAALHRHTVVVNPASTATTTTASILITVRTHLEAASRSPLKKQ